MSPVRTLQVGAASAPTARGAQVGRQGVAPSSLTQVDFTQGGGGTVLAMLSLKFTKILLVYTTACLGSASMRDVTGRRFAGNSVMLSLSPTGAGTRSHPTKVGTLRAGGPLSRILRRAVSGVSNMGGVRFVRNYISGVRFPAPFGSNGDRFFARVKVPRGRCRSFSRKLVRKATSRRGLVRKGKIVMSGSAGLLDSCCGCAPQVNSAIEIRATSKR